MDATHDIFRFPGRNDGQQSGRLHFGHAIIDGGIIPQHARHAASGGYANAIPISYRCIWPYYMLA